MKLGTFNCYIYPDRITFTALYEGGGGACFGCVLHDGTAVGMLEAAQREADRLNPYGLEFPIIISKPPLNEEEHV